jgi:hypothetical protein
MTRHMHTHPCAVCGKPVDCDGELAENHDGFPAVICLSYHLDSAEPTGWWSCSCGAEHQIVAVSPERSEP